MYVNDIRVELRSFQFNDDDISTRREWVNSFDVSTGVDVDMEELQRWVFDTIQPPGWYQCSKTETVSETGGSGTGVEIVITIAEWSSMLAWGVLGNLISDYIKSRSRRDGD